MAELATIARPYAKALFSLEPTDCIAWPALVEELSEFVRLPGVFSIASSPNVSRQQVINLLLSALKSPEKDSSAVKNFVQILVQNHRVQLLPEISAQLNALKNEREGTDDVIIKIAFIPDHQSLNNLVAALERKFHRKLRPTVKIEPELIGGLRVTIGDKVLDISVQAQLAAMQLALTA
ncbi:F0F1 ATP synthase subunit delta [Candidatus Vallotia cooleyia]|uniref:F0F1 ATP synthase subunit delta n=1 Tax=Candidatus Vallotiella adelgis TaxID=1177211 RepID=UPI001D004DAC|nr:F0F1 ATP synthase subunit delta [Candidatus Vallotia cooleyia]UDG81819.1 ATP synthase subunit delta [Candidatus Vallotia cooleyia]